MKLLLVLAAAGTALLAGCASRPFIMGIYDAPRSAFPELSRAGFNVVTLGAGETNRAAYLNAAQTNGIKVILSPALETAEGRAKTVREDRHPALLAWYLVDEPDLNVISPRVLAEKARKVRRLTNKPLFLSLASGTAVEKFGEFAEHVAVDWYPVPWTPVASVAREMRSARLASAGRPFLAILQAFDWNAFPTLLRGEQPLRPPTPAEVRCMAYLSLFHGASGILFYTYKAREWDIREHPEMWETVTQLAGELALNAPVFEERVDWWPAETHYEDPAGMYNDIHEGAIALNVFRVRKQHGGILPGCYMVAINTTARPVRFGYRLPFGAGEWISQEYQPFEVSIVGPITEPLATKRLP